MGSITESIRVPVGLPPRREACLASAGSSGGCSREDCLDDVAGVGSTSLCFEACLEGIGFVSAASVLEACLDRTGFSTSVAFFSTLNSSSLAGWASSCFFLRPLPARLTSTVGFGGSAASTGSLFSFSFSARIYFSAKTLSSLLERAFPDVSDSLWSEDDSSTISLSSFGCNRFVVSGYGR